VLRYDSNVTLNNCFCLCVFFCFNTGGKVVQTRHILCYAMLILTHTQPYSCTYIETDVVLIKRTNRFNSKVCWCKKS